MIELEPLPIYLSMSAQFAVPPPVETRIQSLPYDQLCWTDFERLCLRLAREEAEITNCRRYGVQGDLQEGIDLYGRRANATKFSVFQCKNEGKFGAKKITGAVSLFLNGGWADRSEKFVLCMREGIHTAARENAIDKQRELLQNRGVQFQAWDGEELNVILKDHPKIVIDFFGRHWALLFNGSSAIAEFENRLDVSDVTDYRRRLGTLYRDLFNQHDQGLRKPGPDSSQPLRIESRFVLPEVVVRREVSPVIAINTAKSKRDVERRETGDTVEDEFPRALETTEERAPLVAVLATNRQFVLVGGPGSGKSTALRFLAIDLLSDCPREAELVRTWGQHLPVWLPFAFWTRQVANDLSSPPSLPETIRRWLEVNDERNLWPLIEKALKDERLLLLVDGLDEWANDSSARIAIDLLQTFIRRRGVAAILTSRPQGFQQLGMATSAWTIADFGGFSSRQQYQFVHQWLQHWTYSENPARIRIAVDEFLAELQDSADLAELATVPLLLGILLLNHLKGAQLPSTRFRAYDQLINDLVELQPRQRARSAFVAADTGLESRYLISISAWLAYHMHLSGTAGTLEREQAEVLLREHLRDPSGEFGLTQSESMRWTASYLSLATDSTGLLVAVAPGVIGFFHPALHEFLVAKHLASSERSVQLEVVKTKRADSRWREIILGLLQLSPQISEVERFVKELDSASESIFEKTAVESLLDEIAFGEFTISARYARELAERAFLRVEDEGRPQHRKNAMRQVLNGLRSSKTSDLVRARFEEWLPARPIWRRGLFDAIAKWPRGADVLRGLERGLQDEEPYVQRRAAQALAKHVSDDDTTYRHFWNLISSCHRPSTVAAGIELLLARWAGTDRINGILESCKDATLPQVRLLCALAEVQRGNLRAETFEETLSVAHERNISLDYNPELQRVLQADWGQEQRLELKKSCLSALNTQSRSFFDRDLALLLLLSTFPGDSDVLEYCIQEIPKPSSAFRSSDVRHWTLLSSSFPDSDVLKNLAVEWITERKYIDVDAGDAAVFARSEVAKQFLIDSLEHGTPYCAAAALLDGWGLEDQATASAFNSILRDDRRAASIASLLPRIIMNRGECHSKLKSLLCRSDVHHPDLIMRGIQDNGILSADPEIIGAILSMESKAQFWAVSSALSQLILMYPQEESVRRLAEREIERREGEIISVAVAFPDDAAFRRRILQYATPLPTDLRYFAIERLVTIPRYCRDSMKLMSQYDLEKDAETKSLAAIGYYARLRDDAAVTDHHVTVLKEAAVAVGFDHNERRQAAFCGLAEIARLDVLQSVKASCEGRISYQFDLHERRHYRSNRPLRRQILAHWSDFRKYHGTDFVDISCDSLLIALCSAVEEFPGPKAELISHLESAPPAVYSPELLRFLARVKPNSRLLLDCIMFTLAAQGDWHSKLTASSLLIEQFGGERAVLARLEQMIEQDKFAEWPIVALADGWPTNQILDRVFDEASNGLRSLGLGACARLISLKYDTDAFVAFLLDELSHEQAIVRSDLFRQPVIRRLQNDPQSIMLLRSKLDQTLVASELVSIPRLLSASTGVTTELRAWCQTRLEIENRSPKLPVFGNDVVSGEFRTLRDALFDVLSIA